MRTRLLAFANLGGIAGAGAFPSVPHFRLGLFPDYVLPEVRADERVPSSDYSCL
jgi:hypothetical protein